MPRTLSKQLRGGLDAAQAYIAELEAARDAETAPPLTPGPGPETEPEPVNPEPVEAEVGQPHTGGLSPGTAAIGACRRRACTPTVYEPAPLGVVDKRLGSQTPFGASATPILIPASLPARHCGPNATPMARQYNSLETQAPDLASKSEGRFSATAGTLQHPPYLGRLGVCFREHGNNLVQLVRDALQSLLVVVVTAILASRTTSFQSTTTFMRWS
jgi:hypothetical protein